MRRPGHEQVATPALGARAGAARAVHVGPRVLRRRPHRLRHQGPGYETAHFTDVSSEYRNISLEYFNPLC